MIPPSTPSDRPSSDLPAPSIGENIREWRRKRQLRQGDLAKRTGMSAAQLCHIERDGGTPSIRTLQRIADALGVSMDELTGGAMKNPPVDGEPADVPAAPRESVPSTGHVDFRSMRFLKTAPSGKAPHFQRKFRKRLLGSPAFDISPSARACRERRFEKEKPLGSPPRDIPPSGEALWRETFPELRAVREGATAELEPSDWERMVAKVQEYRAVERAAKAPLLPTIPLAYPAQVATDDPEGLADAMRVAGGIGQSVLFDSISFFEGKGIRVVSMDLPEEADAFAFWDAEARNPYVFLRRQSTDERQQFRMASEMAGVAQYLANGEAPLPDTPANRRFARRFAAAFLMPAPAMRELVYHLGLTPETWTYEALLQVKTRFGVSAEAFAYRLEALDLLRAGLRAEFVRRIHEGYEKSDWAEPNPSNRRLVRHSRFSDLRLLAGRSQDGK